MPFDRFFGAKGSLMDLRIRWTTTDPAKHHFLDTHRVGCAEDRTYIMLTAHIIEYYHQR